MDHDPGPCVILLLKAIRSYYDELRRQVRENRPLQLNRSKPPILVVATEGWNKLTDKALQFALNVSPDVLAVHLTDVHGPEDGKEQQQLRQQWIREVEVPARSAGFKAPRLINLPAPYRRIHVPLLELVEQLKREHPARTVAVLIPDIVKRHWWEHLLHTHCAWRLRNAVRRPGPRGTKQERTGQERSIRDWWPSAAEACEYLAAPPEQSHYIPE